VSIEYQPTTLPLSSTDVSAAKNDEALMDEKKELTMKKTVIKTGEETKPHRKIGMADRKLPLITKGFLSP